MGDILGLHFQTTVDPTAIATLMLALATIGLATFASLALRASHRELNEARERGARMHRPVIIPVLDHGRMDLGPLGTIERMPKLTDAQTLVVPAENIGVGPALYLSATVELLLPGCTSTSNGGGCGKPTELMGLARTSFLPLEIAVSDWPVDASFRLSVEYEDLVDERWQTQGCWDGAAKRWTRVRIARWNEEAKAWQTERTSNVRNFR